MENKVKDSVVQEWRMQYVDQFASLGDGKEALKWLWLHLAGIERGE
jgi:hypothetical protein